MANKPTADSFPMEINCLLREMFDPLGLDFHPFQIGWYNELVGSSFQLEYSPSTLAMVVISGPDTLEKSVLPFLQSQLQANSQWFTNNPLDDAMVHAFQLAKKTMVAKNYEVDIFHDFDLYPSRKPKVLVQTAAHVAGAVQYVHKNDLPLEIQEHRFSKSSKLCGVAVHPKYGGWYAIRGVLIFKNVQLDSDQLQKPEPLNLLQSTEDIARILEEFAYNWENDKWRTVYKGSAEEYSDLYKEFLNTNPENRWNFLKTRILSGA